MTQRPRAKSAVTGGDPEDMNQMPPDSNPYSPDPVHDRPRSEKKPTSWWNNPLKALRGVFGLTPRHDERSRQEVQPPPLG